VAMMVER